MKDHAVATNDARRVARHEAATVSIGENVNAEIAEYGDEDEPGGLVERVGE